MNMWIEVIYYISYVAGHDYSCGWSTSSLWVLTLFYLQVDGFKAVENVVVNKPGQYYYILEPDDVGVDCVIKE